MAVGQKTVIDTLHKEAKPQKVIAKEDGCSQSFQAYSQKVEWKEKVWQKKHCPERIVKGPFKDV